MPEQTLVFQLSPEDIKRELSKPPNNRKAFFAVYEHCGNDCYYRVAWRGPNPCSTREQVFRAMARRGYNWVA